MTPRQRLAARFVAGGSVTLTLACAGLSGAASAPSLGRIAYADEGSGQIVTVSASGTARRPLTSGGTTKLAPAWSPDGQRLAFIAQVGALDAVFTIKRDGGALARVTRGVSAYAVTWSPDGTRLLVSLSSARGREGMAEVDLGARPRPRLRRIGGSRERMALEYSPNGGSIAFQERGAVYTASIDNGRLSRIRRIAAGQTARWMGRGLALAVAQRDGIRAFPLAGGSPRILLRTQAVEAFDLEHRDRRLVFEDFVERGNSDVPHVFVAQVGSTERRDLTPSAAAAEAPTWQPTCTITGTPRTDHLVGTAGNDIICALEGNDTIRAGAGDDLVIGGTGNDTISGGPGSDLLFGGFGRDTIDSRYGGRDVVDGGPGTDSAIADQRDTDTVRSIEVTSEQGMRG